MLNIVVFGSGLGTIFDALATHQNLGLYQIMGLFSDRVCPCQSIALKHQIPALVHSWEDFINTCGVEQVTRTAYDQSIVELLNHFSEKHNNHIDLIVMAGYMKIVNTPLIQKFENKIINVHPADLTILDDQGKRRYIGKNAVYQALQQGEWRTRSTVISVVEAVDEGPILELGPWVPYAETYPVTLEAAKRHQAKQKQLSDIPACLNVLKRIAKG